MPIVRPLEFPWYCSEARRHTSEISISLQRPSTSSLSALMKEIQPHYPKQQNHIKHSTKTNTSPTEDEEDMFDYERVGNTFFNRRLSSPGLRPKTLPTNDPDIETFDLNEGVAPDLARSLSGSSQSSSNGPASPIDIDEPMEYGKSGFQM